MKKSYYLLLTLILMGVCGVQEINAQENFYTKQSTENRHHPKHRNHMRIILCDKQINKSHYTDLKKDRITDIDYRLDMLEIRYKRDKNLLKNSAISKDEKKIREKEIKYQYNREKEYLKAEKKILKKTSY